MKLKSRTTYINGLGQRVCIAGLARRTDITGVFWSIQGDHYTADGRLIWGKPLPKISLKNIVSEDTSAEAKRWWDGVKA